MPRRASLQLPDGSLDTRMLSDWRHLDAYVLLGDPGSGKSVALDMEARASNGLFQPARDFIALGADAYQGGQTLHIDGLDEMRAGQVDGRAPLDAIRARIQALGRPRFRLSCREHDWRAQTDSVALSAVAPGGVVHELHLAPLTTEEQRDMLRTTGAVPDVDAFLHGATERGVGELLGNPLLLDLAVRAFVDRGGWPPSRHAIYESSCRELALEHSDAYRDVYRPKPGEIDLLLDDAGLLCAVLLLSGKSAFTEALSPTPSAIALHELPAQLPLQNARAALASKIFSTVNGQTKPRHRSIAEFLAAKAIAGRVVSRSLPIGRVLALMQGWDGGIVEPLRGLHAWLAVHDARDRRRLIEAEPLSVVLNGDISGFSVDDKLALLRALRSAAEKNPWFRRHQWVSYPLASLATPDMVEALTAVLSDRTPDGSHLALVDCVLDALNHGSPLPELRGVLEPWVEDADVWFRLRMAALEAWKRSGARDVPKELEWLARLHGGDQKDSDARMAADLLAGLYPEHVDPGMVFRFWPKPGAVSQTMGSPYFWSVQLFKQSRPQDFAELADAWIAESPQPRPGRDFEWSRITAQILAEALEHGGEQATDERLYAWLGIGVDEHGFSKLDRDNGGVRVAQWLAQHPDRMKAATLIGWRRAQPEAPSGRRFFWMSPQRLHGAQRPRDWLWWMLDRAAQEDDVDISEYCFRAVAEAAIDPQPGVDTPSLEDMERWVDEHQPSRPQLRQWLAETWTCSLEGNWRSDEYLRQRKHDGERLEAREKRRKALARFIDPLLDGTAPANVLHQLVGAYNERFYDIAGDTPEARVQDFLVSDEATALAAIDALARVLQRSDVPSADETMDLDAKGRYHLLRPSLLLAAQLQHDRDPLAVDAWSDELKSTLIACWLTEGIGNTPAWYTRLVETRPSLVAPLLVRHVLARLKRKGPLSVTGLWHLAKEPSHAKLARLVLGTLLERFPQRASEPARRELNLSLLAGLHMLDDAEASALLRHKLANPSIDTAQHICWLVAALPYVDDAGGRLARLLGKNERRIVEMGIALHDQASLARALKRVSSTTLSHLIELLAPITSPGLPTSGWVGASHNRHDLVRGLIDLLATDASPGAADELRRLSELPILASWKSHLQFSAVSQQGVAREARYVHPTASAAALTLANASPASQADLMALILDHLRDVETHLRGEDAFAVRHFWKDAKSGRVPLPENDCRDLLLERLRPRLQAAGVTVTPERRAAAEKRADLAAEFVAPGRLLAVPIEIKKEDNQQLWLAWRDQLKHLYATNPASGGHGVYVVLWFNHKPRTFPDGGRPARARDVEEHLVELIPQEDRARLAVCVLDLSDVPG